jgi:cell division transport system ATP-binding protein|tara:strand:+ start:111 stop:788 length:678 start_codon:yes stop_codon:yes gene_type:complete
MIENPILQIEDASIFHHFKTILNNVNLKLNRGEFVYVIGKTGSGKSSLLRTIYCDIPLKMGKIIVDNQDISNISKKELPYLRRKIGIIFQDFQLFQDRNAYENIKFIMTSTGWNDNKKMDRKIFELLEKVGLEDKSKNYPFELSGGEQQRLVIARSIVNNPKIIIADEPTGNLDPLIAEKILKLLLEINKSGTSIIMTTHNYNLINKYKKRILKCEDGFVKETSI